MRTFYLCVFTLASLVTYALASPASAAGTAYGCSGSAFGCSGVSTVASCSGSSFGCAGSYAARPVRMRRVVRDYGCSVEVARWSGLGGGR